MSEPVAVPTGQISIDERLQPRCDGLSEDHLTSLMETPETWPPIVLARLNGQLVLIDGFHRVEAASRMGYDSIFATIFEPSADADLFDIAFRLNAKHGRPLTLRDRKAYALTLIAAQPDLADREIGRRASLHHETVGALRTRAHNRPPERKPGELPGDVDVFDPIRFRMTATKDQKAIAGYIARLTTAMDDPYEENSPLAVWPDDPAEIARACVVTMGKERAAATLTSLDADARYILQVTKAAKTLLSEAS